MNIYPTPMPYGYYPTNPNPQWNPYSGVPNPQWNPYLRTSNPQWNQQRSNPSSSDQRGVLGNSPIPLATSQRLGSAGSLLPKLKSFSWSGLLNGAQSTISTVNQLVPLYNQLKPLVSNSKTLLKLSKVMRNMDNLEETTPANSNAKKDNTPDSNVKKDNSPNLTVIDQPVANETKVSENTVAAESPNRPFIP